MQQDEMGKGALMESTLFEFRVGVMVMVGVGVRIRLVNQAIELLLVHATLLDGRGRHRGVQPMVCDDCLGLGLGLGLGLKGGGPAHGVR